jgi:aspartate kinase
VELIDNQCIVAIVGQRLMSDARVGARALEALQGMPVKMISLGRSGLNLSIVVDDAHADEAVKAIHRTLFEAPVIA